MGRCCLKDNIWQNNIRDRNTLFDHKLLATFLLLIMSVKIIKKKKSTFLNPSCLAMCCVVSICEGKKNGISGSGGCTYPIREQPLGSLTGKSAHLHSLARVFTACRHRIGICIKAKSPKLAYFAVPL